MRLLRRRNLGRMALRNIARRPLEAAMVVGGAALGTAIITSAFIAGDTFDATIRDIARTEFGPVDETVRVADLTQLDDVATAVERQALPDSDGSLSLVRATAAVRAGDKAEPLVDLGEVDFDAARAFGDDPDATGLVEAGPTPTGNDAVVNEALADDLEVGRGDTVEIFVYGQRLEVIVRIVVPQVGLAGYDEIYLAPGTIEALAVDAAPGSATGEPPIAEVLVSNAGGVFDGAARTDTVTAALEDRLAGISGIEILSTKQDLLDDAESSGAEFREMFSALGTFSIAVGVLLLVNLFVMLAEERKSELGMLRAIGMKRNHLMRLFGIEGGLYSLAAVVAGSIVGIGVGWAIVQATKQIIGDEADDLTFVFTIKPASLLTGGIIGLVISLLTVWATSARIARLNVIRAIRDLPDPATRRASRLRLALGALGVLLGGVILNAGVSGDAAVPVLIGPALALASAVPLVGRLLPRRAVVAIAGGLAGLWSIAAVELVPDAFDDAGIEMFVVQGLLLVGSAVAVVAQGDRVWAWIADRLADRGGLASRLAVAYPLARRGRTAMLLAMFSLITFMLTFMASLSDAFLAQAPTMAADASAGWDIWVDSSPTNPISAEQLEQDDQVDATATFLRGVARLMPSETADDPDADPTQWPVTGFDDSSLEPGVPKLSDRLGRFDDDPAAYEAVLADPTLAIAEGSILQDEGPTGAVEIELGDRITAISPVSGEPEEFTLVGLVEEDWTFAGLMVGRDAASALLGDRAVANRHFVDVADDADAEVVAERLTANWINYGAEAKSFVGAIEDEMRETQGFIRMLQAYLGLGLLIGVAGLGVVMVRAVRERRRQIGVLRALGFQAQVVRRAFLSEAGFVAFQGIVLGMGLGLVTSYQMLTSDAFDEPLPFTIPWLALLILFVTPAAAALSTAAAPAAQAARIQPAAALRIGE